MESSITDKPRKKARYEGPRRLEPSSQALDSPTLHANLEHEAPAATKPSDSPQPTNVLPPTSSFTFGLPMRRADHDHTELEVKASWVMVFKGPSSTLTTVLDKLPNLAAAVGQARD